MHIKMKSTRHTALGTLRRDYVYTIDETAPRQVAIARNLLDGGDDAPAVKISADAAKKAGVTDLNPKAEADTTNADLRSKIAAMSAELAEAQAKAEQSEKAAAKAKADQAKAEEERDQAKADLDAAAAATTPAKG